jgi:hypothetical protein
VKARHSEANSVTEAVAGGVHLWCLQRGPPRRAFFRRILKTFLQADRGNETTATS